METTKERFEPVNELSSVAMDVVRGLGRGVRFLVHMPEVPLVPEGAELSHGHMNDQEALRGVHPGWRGFDAQDGLPKVG